MLDYSLIGLRIKETRNWRKVSQAQLAEMSELSVSFISNIETGRKKASLKSLIAIADVMDTTVDMLLGIGRSYKTEELHTDFLLLINDCTPYEKCILFDQIRALKASLRNNRHMLN